jgi:hypothetical protein
LWLPSPAACLLMQVVSMAGTACTSNTDIIDGSLMISGYHGSSRIIDDICQISHQ